MRDIQERINEATGDYMKERGFFLQDTGGNCTAWEKPGITPGTYYLITSELSAYGNPLAAEWSAGFYGPAHGEPLAETEGWDYTIEECADWVCYGAADRESRIGSIHPAPLVASTPEEEAAAGPRHDAEEHMAKEIPINTDCAICRNVLIQEAEETAAAHSGCADCERSYGPGAHCRC